MPSNETTAGLHPETHRAARTAPIEGSDLDPGRPRSAGPLTADELAFCRRLGVPLAYDPLQIGWVPALCLDDLDPDAERLAAETDEVAGAGAKGRPDERTSARFEARAQEILRRALRRPLDPEGLTSELWSLPEALVRESVDAPASVRLETLRRLQARANALICERVVQPGERGRRRHEALVRGADYVLRRWHPSEAARFRSLLDDPRVWEHLPEPYPDPLSESMAADLIEISNEARHHEVRAIERDGVPIGQIRLLLDGPFNARDGGARDAEISYWLGRDHWAQGVASAVIPVFTLLAFWKHPLASVFARVDARNVASLRALARAGFRDEGDLACELGGEPGMRTLRCFRGQLLDERAARTARKARATNDAGLATPGAPASA